METIVENATVEKLIEQLKKFNPEENVVWVTMGGDGRWIYTSRLKISQSKFPSGNCVMIR